MKRVIVAMVASAVTGSALAQSATVLYTPVRPIKDQNISVKAWGSGTISETDEIAFEGTNSLRIASRNFFQGGVINFGTPISLANQFSDKSNMLRLTYKVVGAGGSGVSGGLPSGGPAGLGGRGSGPGGPPSGGPAGLGGRGSGPGGPPSGGSAGPGGIGGPPGGIGGVPGSAGQGPGKGGGLPGGGEFGTHSAASATELEKLRLIVTTTDGKKSEAYLPVKSSGSGERGWSSVAVPLQAITGFDRTNKIVKSVAVAPDTTTTFFVGDVRVIGDTTPIRGEANVRTLNLAAGDEVTLTASGTGGSSILRYTWDFDLEKDGIQEDAEGQVVKRRFRKPGKYTITLTISDLYGLKPAYTTTIQATVTG